MNLSRPEKIIIFSLCAITGGGLFFFSDGYLKAVYFSVFASLAAVAVISSISFFDKQDIFSPYYIFPAIFTLVAVLGSAGGKDISVLYIAKIDEFKWPLYLAALSSYFAGILLASRVKHNPGKQPPWDLGYSIFHLKVLLVMGAVSILLFYSLRGGIPLFSEQIDRARFTQTGGLINLLPYLNRTLFVTALISFICLCKLSGTRSARKFVLLAFIVLSTFLISLGGGRSFVQIFFMGIVAYHFLVRPIRVKYLMAGFLVILLLFSVAGYYRSVNKYGTSRINYQLDRIQYPEYLPSWTAPPYVYSRIVAEVFHLTESAVPETVPYQNGKITFGDILTFLPGKQLRPDMYYTEKVLKADIDDVGGTALSFMTSFYFDFGATGIIAGFFLVGFLLQYFYLKMKTTTNEKNTAIYVLALFNVVLGVYGTVLFSPFTIWDFCLVMIFNFAVTRLFPAIKNANRRATGCA